MASPSLPMDVRDINVCLLSAKKKSTSSPSIRDLDQMSLCNFPTSVSVSEDLSLAGQDQLTLRRKRRRPDYDTMSVDMSFREPSQKKARRPLSKVASFATMSPLRHAKNTIKRSLSFTRDPAPSPGAKYRLPATPKHPHTLRRRKGNTTMSGKPQLPQNWVDVMGSDLEQRFSKQEINRQEAIYSIFRTESELVEDLRMIINIFYHPMLRLNLISEEDHCRIFGNIQTILSLHEDLVSRLQELRSNGETVEAVGSSLLEWLRSNGETVEAVGSSLLEWSHTLGPYADYCANLVTAKRALEARKQDPAFEDFLQRCLDSEFSRKIDLWTFLDSPRSRIMKYPILLKEVKKKGTFSVWHYISPIETPADHADHEHLDQAMVSFGSVIKEVDRQTGVAKCLDIINRLEYLHDDQRCPEIYESQFVVCSGVVKNKNGSKLHAFLFDKAFVLTRPASRSGPLMYQVYRQPIPVKHLVVQDVADGDAKIGGSFRGPLKSGNSGCKYLVKVSCSEPQVSRHSHTLQANGDYDKKAWLDAFKTVVPFILGSSPVTTV